MMDVVAPRPLVEIRDLNVSFVSREATVSAVNGVSFDLMAGEVLCIIGESGSGKSLYPAAASAAAHRDQRQHSRRRA
jgi:ABC-type dipeptide/oligopeptide/nickel transport system ATPase component